MHKAIVRKFCVHDVFRDSTQVHVAPLTRERMAQMLIKKFTLAEWRHTETFADYSRLCPLFKVSKKTSIIRKETSYKIIVK